MKRELKAKGETAVVPASVSQLTSLAVLGVDPRRFLELLVPMCAHVSKVGKLRVVRLDDALEALRRSFEGLGEVEVALEALQKLEEDEALGADHDEDGQPTSGDAVLARWGLRRKRPAEDDDPTQLKSADELFAKLGLRRKRT